MWCNSNSCTSKGANFNGVCVCVCVCVCVRALCVRCVWAVCGLCVCVHGVCVCTVHVSACVWCVCVCVWCVCVCVVCVVFGSYEHKVYTSVYVVSQVSGILWSSSLEPG